MYRNTRKQFNSAHITTPSHAGLQGSQIKTAAKKLKKNKTKTEWLKKISAYVI